MSYLGMGLAPPPPGSNLGPDHPVPPIETHFIQKLMLTWGAWPDDGSGYNPMYLAAPSPTGGSLPTISTSEALISLKYQVAAAGVAGLLIGWLLRGGPKTVSANRRRSRRRSHR